MWLLCLGLAFAEAPSTLPNGSKVIYSGVGLSTFSQLDQGPTSARDRALKPRLDLYGSAGLTERLQLSLSAPVLYGTVVDNPALLPCPNLLQDENYCDPYLTVGAARLDGRASILRDTFRLTAGLAAIGDPWNRALRGRYNSAGAGTASAEAFAIAGPVWKAGDWGFHAIGVAGFAYSVAPKVTSADGQTSVKAPGDLVRGSVEVKVSPPVPVAFEVAVHGSKRLTGVALDPVWTQQWFGSSLDRWNVLQTGLLAGSAKASFDLPQSMGVHVGVGWLFAVAEGPSDLLDVSVGWHKYFAPKAQD